jgi:hypothetical protein
MGRGTATGPDQGGGGQIIEQGTHQELLELRGTYARLWQHQSGGFLDEEANPRMLTTAQ